MDEKLQILKMVEDGKITVEEAAKLLEAIGTTEQEEALVLDKSPQPGLSSKTKWLRVRVRDNTNKTKVNVNVPVALVDIGLKLSAAYDSTLQEKLGKIDLNEIIEAIKEGAEGKLVDVETEDGEFIEVTVD